MFFYKIILFVPNTNIYNKTTNERSIFARIKNFIFVLAKKTLKSENNYIYRVLGIVSSAKDYRICHYLNKELSFKFCAVDEINIEQKIGQTGFNMKQYTYQPDESISKYFFINNKN